MVTSEAQTLVSLALRPAVFDIPGLTFNNMDFFLLFLRFCVELFDPDDSFHKNENIT